MPYIGQRPSKGDENNFKILDDISSYTLTFDGSDSSVVSAANDTITSLNHRFVQGQRVTYTDGDGSAIAGLTDATVYFIIKEDHNTIKLATSASNASNGVAVNITNVGSGSSHTLNVAFDGVNTKFKATHTTGQKARITRSAQLVISMNGVIQQPHDTATPSTGFGFDLDGTIVFSQAPVSSDVFWAHVLTNNNVTFDISDNDIDNFTGDGSTVSFNLTKSPPDNRNVLVTVDGVVQYPNDPDGTERSYTVVENVLTFSVAPALGTEVQVRHIGFAGSSSGSGSGGVTSVYGRTGAVVLKSTDNITVNDAAITGNATVTGDLTVNGTTTTLDTQLVEVDKIEVETESTNVAVAVTHNGSGDLIRLYDGTTQKVTVDDEGKVGLGSAIPAEKLDITGNIKLSTLSDTTTNSYLKIAIQDSDGVLKSDDSVKINPAQNALDVDGLNISSQVVRTNNLEELRLTTGAGNGTVDVKVNSNQITLLTKDDTTDAFSLKQGSNEYITVDTNNSSELITLGNTTTNPKTIILGGNVGINTTTPTTKLEVQDFVGSGGFVSKLYNRMGHSDVGGHVLFLDADRSDTNNTRLIDSKDNKFIVYSHGGAIFSENVGIVTTVPQSKLELDGRFRILDNSDGTPSSGKGLEISYYTSDDKADILSYDRGASAYKDLMIRGNSIDLRRNNTSLLLVGTGGASGTVGFSTTTALVTNGEKIAVRGYSSFKSTNSSYAAIYTNNELEATNVLTPHILFNNNGANRGGFGYHDDNNTLIMGNHTNIMFKTGANALGGTERLRITNTGSVGIGTSVPGMPLHLHCTVQNAVKWVSSNSDGPLTHYYNGAIHLGNIGNSKGVMSSSNVHFGIGSKSDLLFGTKPSGGGSTVERLRIKEDGGILQTKTGGNANYTISRNESVGTTDQTIGVIDFASNTAHTVQARVMGKTRGTSNVGGDLVIEARANGGSLDERVRITGGGLLLIGRSSSRMVGGSTTYAKLQVAGTSQSDSSISLVNNEDDTHGPFVFFGKTRGSSVNTSTIVQSGDTLGGLSFIGADSTDLNNRTAEITAVVNGSPTGNTIPTDLTFSTSTQNATQMAERMRIYSSGRILIGNGGSEHSPQGNLDIVGDTNSNGPELYLRVSNNNTTDNIGALIFGNNVDKTVCMIRGSTHTANNTGDIEFHTSTTGTMTERLRIKNTGTVISTITSPDPYNTVNENITIANGAGNQGAGSKIRFATGNASAHIESRVTGGNSNSGTSLNFATSPANTAAEECFRITPSGNILQRARPYSNTHQNPGFGMGRYVKSGWLMAQSSFNNPVMDLVDLLDQGNAYQNMFFKVTAMQLRFRGSNNPEGQIHTGYASAKRDPSGTNTWYAFVGTMQLENAASGFSSGSNVGTLSWSASNNFDTATLRYTGNREDNYDTYQVCVEIWMNFSDSLSYKLSSGYLA